MIRDISVIITVLNEVDNIQKLIDSLLAQTQLPKELVIVDGGSTDGTWSKLKDLSKKYPQMSIKVAFKSGNRSVGRNQAVALSKFPWLAFTDAGCVPDKNWLEELTKALRKGSEKFEIVSGYFYGLTSDGFGQAVTAYALAMPRVIKNNFMLPTTRSMLIHRSVLSRLGGFDESLSDNEDYALARKMLKFGYKEKMVFAPRAKVGWIPCKTWRGLAVTLYRFARGDAFANLFRPKVLLIFLRYFLAFIWFCLGLKADSWSMVFLLGLIVLFYLLWAILKNYPYAKKGWYFLPVMQILSDVLVMLATSAGLSKKITKYY